MVTGDTTLHFKTQYGYTALRTFDELKEISQDILSQYTVFTNQGYKHFGGIRITHNVPDILIIEFSDGSNLKCSHSHLILVENNQFVEAEKLKKGDLMAGFGLRVKSINLINNNVYPLYDLENVEDIQLYYTNRVLSQSIK